MPDPILLSLAEGLAADLLKSGAGFLGRFFVDTPQQKAIQKIWSGAFLDLFSQSTAPAYPAELATLLRHFLRTASTADQLLAGCLRQRQPDLSALRRQFEASESYYDPAAFLETYQIDFDELLRQLLSALERAIASEQTRLDSPLSDYILRQQVDEILRRTGDLPPSTPSSPDPLPPPEVLPDPGPQRPGWRLRFYRNQAFTGREKDLLELARSLFHTPQAAAAISQPVAASGLGGIGKTQLAVEFCYRYGRFTQAVHWLDASKADGLPAEIAACGLALNLQPWPDELPGQVARTLQAWREQPDRLVVLDNLEDPRLLAAWLDQFGPVRLLVTTRRTRLPRSLGLRTQRLGYFKRQESRALLRWLAPRLRRTPVAELDALAERLYHLPLALHVAGLYLDQNKDLSPAGYLEKWHLAYQPLAASLASDRPTGHELSLAATLQTSLDQLDPADPLDLEARKVFIAAGYCAPNIPIPDPVLFDATSGKISREEYDHAFERYHQAVARLVDLGLASPSARGPYLHPLLAEFARLQDNGASLLPVSEQSYEYFSRRYGFGFRLLSTNCIIQKDGSAEIVRNVILEARSQVREIERLNIDPPLEAGEELAYQQTHFLTLPGLYSINQTQAEVSKRNDPMDYWAWQIGRPTRKLILKVTFPFGSMPDEFYLITGYALSQGMIPIEQVNPSQTTVQMDEKGGALTAEIEYPYLNLIYMFGWKPKVRDTKRRRSPARSK